ncbi:YugE family protein [Bacillus halotolerans]|uniref:YugE family protein n=1 Tax=Bacillus halotolerans TaxID=260554 RepID=UPI0020C59CF4|nr:YugE family protein [Bacillus halotolerans]UTL71844.1 YugE family protein [Bacillus halotolerans]
MEESQAVREMINVIAKWDPFKYGEDFYETEAVDVVQAVYDEDDPEVLAKSIQHIFEASFEQTLPIDSCRNVAGQLLFIKDSRSCTP